MGERTEKECEIEAEEKIGFCDLEDVYTVEIMELWKGGA